MDRGRMTMSKNSFTNNAKLVLFCAIVGAVAGIVFWLFLLLIKGGTYLLWELLPAQIPVGFGRWYPLVICTVGGLLIGLYRKFLGDYPEDMMTVFGKLKKQGTYNYKRLHFFIIAALLPLIFGASVGPEAGMVGIIVGLCCWAGDNLRFAGKKSADYSRIGAAVSLSVMFRSPLFGFFEVEEDSFYEPDNDADREIKKPLKILLYCIAAGAGAGCYYLLNRLYKVSEGFPTFDKISLETSDILLAIICLAAGILLGLFFELSEKIFEKIASKTPAVVSELIAGAVLGIAASLLPVIRFSGEEQMGILIEDFALYAPLAMIGIAFLKIVLTNMCIKMGLKGGHFFPLIFAAVCMGYGISLLIFPGNSDHATFAAALVCAGTLGVTVKKPLAVSMLLLLCFPVSALVWIVPAAALASLVRRKNGPLTPSRGSKSL